LPEKIFCPEFRGHFRGHLVPPSPVSYAYGDSENGMEKGKRQTGRGQRKARDSGGRREEREGRREENGKEERVNSRPTVICKSRLLRYIL